jgi:hypothetical protein
LILAWVNKAIVRAALVDGRIRLYAYGVDDIGERIWIGQTKNR